MKPHWFYILLSTSSAARYGSAIQEDVRALSDGNVRLWPATLYGSLEELTERAWIAEVDEGDRPDGGGGRERFYRITDEGRRALRGEIERMEALAGLARARMDGGAAST